ncbi:MAG: hypothetical protein QXE06_06920 [Candidatus Bathyarchaeia archaeon]
MSGVEAELLGLPERDQVRLALIYIGKFLEKITVELQRLNKTLEDVLSILDEGSIHVHTYSSDWREPE